MIVIVGIFTEQKNQAHDDRAYFRWVGGNIRLTLSRQSSDPLLICARRNIYNNSPGRVFSDGQQVLFFIVMQIQCFSLSSQNSYISNYGNVVRVGPLLVLLA